MNAEVILRDIPSKDNFNNIPNELKSLPQWVLWKKELRDGKITKIPYRANGLMANSTERETWATFDNAVQAFMSQPGRFNGIGFVFSEADPYTGVDIDNCIDEQGQISPEALNIIQRLGSYAEQSQSRQGIHIIVRGRKPGKRCKKKPYEMYDQGRYFALTGDTLVGYAGIREAQAELEAVYYQFFGQQKDEPVQSESALGEHPALTDKEIIDKAINAANGDAFFSLFSLGDTRGQNGDESAADLALCNLLAFWTNANPERMDQLFRQSALYREKWDRKDYRERTIQAAIKGLRQGYEPYKPMSAEEAFADVDFEDDELFLEEESGREPLQLRQSLSQLHPNHNQRYPLTDIGNGNLFADCFKDIARYEPDRKKWFIFNGKVWRLDSGGLKAMQLCKKLAKELMLYALSISDERERQQYMEFCGKWQSRHYRETILKDATSVYPVMVEEFDVNPMILNCQNGTLNLETGEFYAHRSSDMLTKLAGVNYNPIARSPRWEQFISEVMRGDQDKAVFLQKSLGYTLTGDTRHECFFILYGPLSRNGKGTTMETFMKIMGDYGKSANPETIAQRQKADSRGPSEDIASLAGARFVNISEPDKKLVLSAALVKTLTGNDKIRCRFLNENGFEFYPQFKLFINTNYLPAVTDDTIFLSNRVKIIPFERHFEENEQDKNLKKEFANAENLSGILNWCIEGLRLLNQKGFDMPESVILATDEYRRNSDKIGRFLSDEMEAKPLAETRTSDAYSRYRQWCNTNGFYPENAANFKLLLSKVVTVILKRPRWGGGATNLILGYSLRSEFESAFDTAQND